MYEEKGKELYDTATVAIYDIISDNLVNGELPEDFSLPSEAKNNELYVVDGAMDGITLYHIGRSPVSSDSLHLIDILLRQINEGDFDSAFLTLSRFAEKNTAIGSIDEFEGCIMDNVEQVNPSNLFNFAVECMTCEDRELVKFGLEMMEIFAEPTEDLKGFLRILGLSDEFTLFVLFNIIINWSNANEEIFALAKKVHGWGRIHAVERLRPETDEIRTWLLREGMNNKVSAEYSANAVFRKADVAGLLKKKLSDEDFSRIALIMECLMSDGPMPGIRAVPDADEVLSDFLKQVTKHKLTFEIIDTVYRIAINRHYVAEKKKCDEILKTAKAEIILRKAIMENKGIAIAKYLDIDTAELIYDQMVADFGGHFQNCTFLIKNDEYREKVLDLFRKRLPLYRMANDKKQNYGLGSEYKDYTALVMLIGELKSYPMCGVDFVKLGLISPVANNRDMALQVLGSWCDLESRSLNDLSSELAAIVREVKETVPTDKYRDIFEKLGI